MMTHEEAIKCIEDVLDSDYHYDESLGYQLTSDDFEWLEKAKEVLKKRTPQKPIIESAHYVDFDDFLCPFCKNKIISRLDGKWTVGKPQKYCDECGQALDWSDT